MGVQYGGCPLNPSVPYCRDVRGVSGGVHNWATMRIRSARLSGSCTLDHCRKDLDRFLIGSFMFARENGRSFVKSLVLAANSMRGIDVRLFSFELNGAGLC